MSSPAMELILAAEQLAATGEPIALLHGEGWGDTLLAIEPRDEVRIPVGVGAFDAAKRAISSIERALVDRREPAIGVLAYEATRDLERTRWSANALAVDRRALPVGAALIVRRFGAVATTNALEGVRVEGSDPRARQRLERAIAAAPSSTAVASTTLHLEPTESDRAHEARVHAAIELISRGDLYQVCLARRFRARFDGPLSALHHAVSIRERARFGAWLDLGDHALVSASPELFLDVRGESSEVDAPRVVRTSPIKGTRPRGTSLEDDAKLRADLDADPKERAELAMVVDLERNDLGRACTIGTIRPDFSARIESTPTVHHRVHDVRGALRRDVDLGALLAVMAPSGSVTGAPKIRAMEVIAQLEADRRGVYCGTIFWMRGGSAPTFTASMAIRTLVARRDGASYELTYDAGGGIVADSDPPREARETRWKAACFDG